ncbi:hypothetical protein MRX96_018908 [Rhipicephalus microplus]
MREAISVAKRVAVSLYRLVLYGLTEKPGGRLDEDAFANRHGGAYEGTFAVTGFPQGVGVLDGCHFLVSPPKKYASDYYNYKGWYSMILLALVDHRYRFRCTNVGSPGRCHDSFV